MALRQLESGRRVHPRIRDDDEDSGSRAAQRDDAAGGEVGRPRDQVPTVQVDAEEDRLGEEREPFERERHPDDGAANRMNSGHNSPSSNDSTVQDTAPT